MDVLISILNSAFWVILAITILVFIHELGHFLTAKWFGMRVERFSVGFPPNLFGRTVGGTEYVVGATPLGGYVKISGMIDESLDTDYQESEPQSWEFRSKPVWQRIVVITAGVIFNVILAVIIFAGINWFAGEEYIPAENVSSFYVEEGSVAYDMGLRTGDRIQAVNGNSFERVDQLLSPQALIEADTLTVTVERNGETRVLHGPPDIVTRVSRAQQESGSGFGVGFAPSILSRVADGTPADSAGLAPGDRIIALDGEPVAFWSQLATRISASEGRPLTVRWFRADSLLSGSLDAVPLAAARPDAARPDTARPDATNPAATTEADSAAVRAATVGADSIPRPPVLVERRADGVVLQNVIAATQQNGRYVFGINSPSEPQLKHHFGVRHVSYGPLEAVGQGVRDSWEYSVTLVVSLKRIVVGRDDVRENLGGPVAIAQITSQAAASGAVPFWRIVAILSVTLAIMNILPIPALDGGQLMFLLYEAITRRRPSVRVRLIAQQVGMVLLLGFMTFLIFNDILRTIG